MHVLSQIKTHYTDARYDFSAYHWVLRGDTYTYMESVLIPDVTFLLVSGILEGVTKMTVISIT